MSMLCSATAAISCSCSRKAARSELTPCSPRSLLLHTPRKDVCSTAVSNLTKGLHSHSFFVGRACLRMGYPITWVAKLITEYLSRAVLKFFLTSGMPLERAAACARCPSFCECWWLSEPQLKCCNRMFTYLFQEAKKKKKQCKRKAPAREQYVLCNAFSSGTSIAGNKIKSLKPSLKLHLPLTTFSNLSNKLTFAIVRFFWISFLTDLTSTIYHKAFSSCLKLSSVPSP